MGLAVGLAMAADARGAALLDQKLMAMEEKLDGAGKAADLSVSLMLKPATFTDPGGGALTKLPDFRQLLSDYKSGKMPGSGDEGGAPVSGSEKPPVNLGDMDVGLKGGKYTNFGLSSFALDLSGSVGKLGLKFLMKPLETARSQQNRETSGDAAFSDPDARQAAFKGSDKLNQRQRSLLPKSLSPDFQQDLQRQLEGEEAGGQAPNGFAGSYDMRGIRMDMGMGRFTLGLLNWHQEPEQQETSFYGANITGPYALGTTSLFPGSERVNVNGNTLPSGAYDLDTAKGEIHFDTPLSTTDRVTITYDTLGAQQDSPGNFTGLRLSGPLSGNPIGFSSLSRDMVGFERGPDGKVLRKATRQELMGVDGSWRFGKHEFTFDAATSMGDRRRGGGLPVSVVLSPSASIGLDHTPDGPYPLPKDRLPIVQDSVQVFIDGFLVPTTQYVVDQTQGFLTFQQNAIHFTGLEQIEVRWRFREDVAEGNLETQSGDASSLSLKGEMGAIRYELGRDATSEFFFGMGSGSASGQSEANHRLLAVTLGKDHSVEYLQDDSSRLLDETRSLSEAQETTSWKYNIKRSRFSLDYQRQDQLHSGNQSSETHSQKASGELSLSQKLKVAFSGEDSVNNNGNRSGATRGFELKTKVQPMRNLSVDLLFGNNSQMETVSGSATTKGGSKHDIALDWKPSEAWQLRYQLGQTPAAGRTRAYQLSFSPKGNKLKVSVDGREGESAGIGQGLSASALLGTRDSQQKRQVQWMPKNGYVFQWQSEDQSTLSPGQAPQGTAGNQLMLNISPKKTWRVMALQQNRTQTSPQGANQTNIQTLQGGFLFLHRWDVGANLTTLNQNAATADIASNQWNLQLKTPKQQFIRELVGQVKWNNQQTDTAISALSASAGLPMGTSSTTEGLEWKIEAQPFWKEHAFSLSREASQTATRGSLPTAKTTLRALMEVPFIGQSRFEFTWELQDQGQAAGDSHAFEMLLKGEVSKTLTLRGGYRLHDSMDASGKSLQEEQWSLEGEMGW